MFNGFDPSVSLWVALGLAVLVSGFFFKSRLTYLTIQKITARNADPTAHTVPPDCMVVIPARDEEASIARTVRSFPHDTVIVVDDHSEDGTAEVARQAGAGVLPAPELPRGAVGKSNACMAGARVLTSRWILFADADTWFEPGFLNAVVECAESSDLAFLSVYLRPEWETWAEAVLAPYAMALFFCGVSPGADPASVFNGQCLLVRRDAYHFIGGHLAVLNNLVEDVKLAALAERHRLNFAVARTPDLGHVRMAAAGEMRDWIERSAFRFMLVSPLMGITIILAAVSMALWLPVLAWLVIDQEWWAAGAFGLLPIALLWSWYRGLRALLAPVAIYAMLSMVVSGLIAALTGRPVEWKGRTI